MLRLALITAAFISLASCNLELKDCHPSGNSIVKFSNVVVEPYPPSLPGQIKLSLDVEVTEEMTNFDVNITLVKHLFGFPIKVPCIDNLGSCYYDNVCPVLDKLFPEDCPSVLPQCQCPFTATKRSIRDLPLDLPKLPPQLAPIVSGKYDVSLTLQDNVTKSILSCLNIKLEIK